MYTQYWDLEASPFESSLDPRWFCETAVHEEALARLCFLIEQRRRFGVLVGPGGTGKSLLLHLLARQTRRTQRETVCVDLFGLEVRDVLWRIASAFGLDPGEADSTSRLWLHLQDHLTGLQSSKTQAVLLLDQLESAEASTLGVVERLVRHNGLPGGRLTIFCALRPAKMSPQAQFLSELADLQIDLPPLDVEQSAEYVRELLRMAGAAHEIFSEEALEKLAAYSGGVPRELNRLCDLSLLAGMGDQRRGIDGQVVDSVARELRISAPGHARAGLETLC